MVTGPATPHPRKGTRVAALRADATSSFGGRLKRSSGLPVPSPVVSAATAPASVPSVSGFFDGLFSRRAVPAASLASPVAAPAPDLASSSVVPRPETNLKRLAQTTEADLRDDHHHGDHQHMTVEYGGISRAKAAIFNPFRPATPAPALSSVVWKTVQSITWGSIIAAMKQPKAFRKRVSDGLASWAGRLLGTTKADREYNTHESYKPDVAGHVCVKRFKALPATSTGLPQQLVSDHYDVHWADDPTVYIGRHHLLAAANRLNLWADIIGKGQAVRMPKIIQMSDLVEYNTKTGNPIHLSVLLHNFMLQEFGTNNEAAWTETCEAISRDCRKAAQCICNFYDEDTLHSLKSSGLWPQPNGRGKMDGIGHWYHFRTACRAASDFIEKVCDQSGYYDVFANADFPLQTFMKIVVDFNSFHKQEPILSFVRFEEKTLLPDLPGRFPDDLDDANIEFVRPTELEIPRHYDYRHPSPLKVAGPRAPRKKPNLANVRPAIRPPRGQLDKNGNEDDLQEDISMRDADRANDVVTYTSDYAASNSSDEDAASLPPSPLMTSPPPLDEAPVDIDHEHNTPIQHIRHASGTAPTYTPGYTPPGHPFHQNNDHAGQRTADENTSPTSEMDESPAPSSPFSWPPEPIHSTPVAIDRQVTFTNPDAFFIAPENTPLRSTQPRKTLDELFASDDEDEPQLRKLRMSNAKGAEHHQLQEKRRREKEEQERESRRRRREEDERLQQELRRIEEEERLHEETKRLAATGLRAPELEVIGPLTAQWHAKVMGTIARNAGNNLATSPEGSNLGAKDFQTVVPHNVWLNDEIVNGTLLHLANDINSRAGITNPKSQTPKCHAFTSFFWTPLKSKGFKGTERWMKRMGVTRDNFLDIDTILIPICESNHWTIVVVRPTRKTITHMDSLSAHGGGRASVTNIVHQWVRDCLGDKYSPDWRVVNHASPMQTNGHDCGVHAITNAMFMSLGLDPACYHAGDMPTQRLRVAAVLLNRGFTGDFDLSRY